MSRKSPKGGPMKPARSTGSRLLRKPCRGCSSFTRPRRSVSCVMSASSGTRAPAELGVRWLVGSDLLHHQPRGQLGLEVGRLLRQYEAGFVLPQKSTYFQPKLATGLVMQKIRADQPPDA